MQKLTENELDSLKTLQTSFSKIYFEIGELEIRKKLLEENLEKVNTEIQYIFLDFKTLEGKEKQLSVELNAKYGTGTIDVDKGEITPFS